MTMGRHLKNIITNEGIDRRDIGYYSTPDFIAKFITESMLSINPNGNYVLDPAVGKEELLKYFHKNNKIIDSFDIIEHSKYIISNFKKIDFIKHYIDLKSNIILDQSINLKYDYYILNPPYNCHETEYIKNNKNVLKSYFDDIGTYNMYSMFISAVIDCAKEGALIGIITLDSFLTSKMHENLRKKFLNECAIHYLILCPADLFWDQKADVKTSILILQKGTKFQKKIKISNRPENKIILKSILETENFFESSINDILLKNEEDSFEFLVECPQHIKKIFDFPRLGSMFKCITGISTGEDNKYISKERNSKYSIPFYKNPGSNKFFTLPNNYLINNFLDIEKSVKNFIVRNKPLLFNEGITCSSMGVTFGACYLPPNSTFGVNANIICDKNDIWWLLSYLNSSLVTYIVRSCLIRSNMITSGYVSKIPIPQFDYKVKTALQEISKEAYDKKISKTEYPNYIKKIDNIITNYLSIPTSDIEQINSFVTNLYKNV